MLTDLRIADIVTLLAVRRTGSVTGAARELKVSPSQVSKAIARLEGELHMKLLIRGARGVTPSDGCLRIVPQLEDVVTRLREIHRKQPEQTHELTIAAPSYLNTAFLPKIAAAEPDLRLRGLDLAPALIRSFATQNLFDLAFTVGQERLPSTWDSFAVGDVRKGLFASPRLARKLGKRPDASALTAIPFISPIFHSGGQLMPVDDDCPLPYAARRLGTEIETIGLALELAVHTEQLVFGPVVAAAMHIQRGGLAEIKVKDWDVRQPLYLACNASRVTKKLRDSIAALVRAQITALEA